MMNIKFPVAVVALLFGLTMTSFAQPKKHKKYRHKAPVHKVYRKKAPVPRGPVVLLPPAPPRPVFVKPPSPPGPRLPLPPRPRLYK